MNAVRRIAIYHFKKEVFKKSYLLTLFSLPFFLLLMIGLISLVDSVESRTLQVGIVDPGGFIQSTRLDEEDPPAVFIQFSSEEEAVSRLESDQEPLDGVYVLAADYPASREIDLIVREPLPWQAQQAFGEIIQRNLLAGEDPALLERVLEGSNLTVRATAYNREFPASNPTATLFVPLALSVIYVFTIIPISGIMTGALGEEKVNRTIEVVLTSVSTRELLTGKILAVSAIAVFQITFWILLLILSVWSGGNLFGIEWLQGISVPWRDTGAIALLALPGFVFYGAALVLIGSLLEDAESLAQVGGLVFFPLFLPMYVLPMILEQPDSTLAIIFSVIPFTSVQTVGLQSIFMQVSGARIAAGAAISWLCAIGLIWLASRAFRIGMLRYGKRIRIGELFGRAASAQ